MNSCSVLEQVGPAWQANEVAPDLLLEHITRSTASKFIFADFQTFRSSSHLQNAFSARYSVPNYFWTETYRRLNGFFQIEPSSDPAQVTAFSTCFRFLVKHCDVTPDYLGSNYVWNELGFVYHKTSSGSIVVLCLDLPKVMQDALKGLICAWRRIPPPTAVHSCITGEVVQLYDQSVWMFRGILRKVEKSRDSGLAKDEEPNFPFLHNIARHVIHSTETLEVAVHTITLMAAKLELAEASDHIVSHHRLNLHQQTLCNIRARSKALEGRLRNEISLVSRRGSGQNNVAENIWAFNLVALRDGRTNLLISSSARQDSAAMKTISFVTMAFLPATFVSTIFSMSFFNFTPSPKSPSGSWVVSDKIWIYWSFAGPLTIATITLWYMRDGGSGKVLKRCKNWLQAICG